VLKVKDNPDKTFVTNTKQGRWVNIITRTKRAQMTSKHLITRVIIW